MKTRKVRTKSSSSPEKSKVAKGYTYLKCSDEESTIETDLQRYTWWFFGVPKIGKSAVATRFPKARIAATEKGHKSQRIKGEDLVGLPWPAYEEFLDYMNKTSKYETSVVDVLEKAYEACYEYMIEELKIDPTIGPQWGEWADVRKPFIQWCKSLMSLDDKGCVFISHASSKEMDDSTGETTAAIHPNFSGRLLTTLEGEVDIIAYFTYKRNHRVIQIQGDDEVRAGNRLTDNFLDQDGKPLKYIPMGGSASEAYENILRAFENKQKFSHLEHIFPRKDATPKKAK